MTDVLDRLKAALSDRYAIEREGEPRPTRALIRRMRERGMELDVFLPLAPVDGILGSGGVSFDGVVLVAPGHWWTAQGERFRRTYQHRYGHPPPAAAAYAYDGMCLIIAAVERAGLNRERIRDAVANIYYPDGVTGPIWFDTAGNRLGRVALMEIVDGRPRLLEGR